MRNETRALVPQPCVPSLSDGEPIRISSSYIGGFTMHRPGGAESGLANGNQHSRCEPCQGDGDRTRAAMAMKYSTRKQSISKAMVDIRKGVEVVPCRQFCLSKMVCRRGCAGMAQSLRDAIPVGEPKRYGSTAPATLERHYL